MARKRVAMARDLKPDVVTMDIIMPILNGVDADGQNYGHQSPAQSLWSQPSKTYAARLSRWTRSTTVPSAILALPPLDSDRDLNVLALAHPRDRSSMSAKVKTVRLQNARPRLRQSIRSALMP